MPLYCTPPCFCKVFFTHMAVKPPNFFSSEKTQKDQCFFWRKPTGFFWKIGVSPTTDLDTPIDYLPRIGPIESLQSTSTLQPVPVLRTSTRVLIPALLVAYRQWKDLFCKKLAFLVSLFLCHNYHLFLVSRYFRHSIDSIHQTRT